MPEAETGGRELESSVGAVERDAEWSGKSYEQQIQALLELLEHPNRLDGEAAFRLLSRIQPQARRRGEADRSDALVLALCAASAQVQRKHASQLLGWRISNALAAGRFDVLLSLVDDLARSFPADIERGLETMHELEYHGQLPRLVDIGRRAWPRLVDSNRISAELLGEFVRAATLHEIFLYLERSTEPRADDPELLTALEPLIDDPSSLLLDDFLLYLTASEDRRWQPELFTFRERGADRDLDAQRDHGNDHPPHDEGPDPAGQQLYFLSLEFLGYLRRREGVAHTKGELGRGQLVAYLLQRQADRQEDSTRGADLPVDLSIGAAASLCPDRRSLDQYLRELLDPQQPLPYHACALFELLPAWLRFLDAQGLITTAQRFGVLEDIAPAQRDLLRFVEQHGEDPALSLGLKAWRLNAERELVAVR